MSFPASGGLPLDGADAAALAGALGGAPSSEAAVVLFVIAGLCFLRGVFTLGDEGGIPDAAYRFGYKFTPFLVAAILLSIGLVVRSNHRDKRRDTAGRWPQTYEQWQQLRQVWRATWLCRRCRVAFLPAASPGIPVAQFSQWTAAVARRDERPGH